MLYKLFFCINSLDNNLRRIFRYTFFEILFLRLGTQKMDNSMIDSLAFASCKVGRTPFCMFFFSIVFFVSKINISESTFYIISFVCTNKYLKKKKIHLPERKLMEMLI